MGGVDGYELAAMSTRVFLFSRTRFRERIAALLTVKEFEENKFVVMGTRKGVIKKTDLTAFSNPRADGIIANVAACRAFVFPGVEDFGITPVEAQASGRPVLAWRADAAERAEAAAALLAEVRAPTLLVVGGADVDVLAINRQALGRLVGGEDRRELAPEPGQAGQAEGGHRREREDSGEPRDLAVEHLQPGQVGRAVPILDRSGEEEQQARDQAVRDAGEDRRLHAPDGEGRGAEDDDRADGAGAEVARRWAVSISIGPKPSTADVAACERRSKALQRSPVLQFHAPQGG